MSWMYRPSRTTKPGWHGSGGASPLSSPRPASRTETREQVLSIYRFSKAIYQSVPVDFTFEVHGHAARPLRIPSPARALSWSRCHPPGRCDFLRRHGRGGSHTASFARIDQPLQRARPLSRIACAPPALGERMRALFSMVTTKSSRISLRRSN